MRVLLIKTSSMGDLIHTLPALTDAARAIPELKVDWVAEEAFLEIPRWHPVIDQVIPIALRRWRRNIISKQTRLEWRTFRERLKANRYDLILDAQGLVKSAFLSLFARGRRVGLNFASAREPFTSLIYHDKHEIDRHQHAVSRNRQLFSQALGYELDWMNTPPDYGIHLSANHHSDVPYLVFLHATTWTSKQWPESYWITLAKLVANAGYRVKLTSGNPEELARAARIASHHPYLEALPKLSLSEAASLLSGAKGVVAVDTGFAHLAAALSVPTVSLYGPTNPVYTGTCGEHQIHLASDFGCAPCLKRQCGYQGVSQVTPACFERIMPEYVWDELKRLMVPS